MHILDGPRLKLTWAEKHLNALEEAFTAFIQANPLAVTRNLDPERGLQVLRMELPSTRTPPDFSILAGYSVHDMRSALDWLICRLCEHEGAKDLNGVEFPIYDHPPRNDRFEYKIRWLPNDVKEAIRLLQPYYVEERYGHGARSQMLWELHRLDITDKHRGLIGHATMGEISMPAGATANRPDDSTVEVIMPFQNNDFDPKPTIDVAFRVEQVPRPITLARLWEIHNFISKGVIPMLTAHIPQRREGPASV